MPPISAKAYQEDIQRLDVALRELKVKYDQFFAGALDRQPIELRAEVERIIDRMNRHPPGKFALRYHFNALLARYQSFSELWGKTVRTMEEGDHRGRRAVERQGAERLLSRCVVSDPALCEKDLRRMHSRFVAARARQGKGAVPYEKFARGIAAQTRQLRSKHECGQIEVRLIEKDDGVQIRARPGR